MNRLRLLALVAALQPISQMAGAFGDARASIASEPAERSERRSGERATLSGSPRGEAPRMRLVASVSPLSAHDNYRIIGTVLKVSGTTLDVKQTKDGKTISMEFTKTSRVIRDKKKVNVTELKSGTNVVVDGRGDSLLDLDIVEVRIVAAPAKK